MKKRKRMGRPPAQWMFELINIKFDRHWTNAYQVASLLNTDFKKIKLFFAKLPIKPKYEIENGISKAQFKVSELKKSVKDYTDPWTK